MQDSVVLMWFMLREMGSDGTNPCSVSNTKITPGFLLPSENKTVHGGLFMHKSAQGPSAKMYKLKIDKNHNY